MKLAVVGLAKWDWGLQSADPARASGRRVRHQSDFSTSQSKGATTALHQKKAIEHLDTNHASFGLWFRLAIRHDLQQLAVLRGEAISSSKISTRTPLSDPPC
jgi:hypothetical protein